MTLELRREEAAGHSNTQAWESWDIFARSRWWALRTETSECNKKQSHNIHAVRMWLNLSRAALKSCPWLAAMTQIFTEHLIRVCPRWALSLWETPPRFFVLVGYFFFPKLRSDWGVFSHVIALVKPTARPVKINMNFLIKQGLHVWLYPDASITDCVFDVVLRNRAPDHTVTFDLIGTWLGKIPCRNL